MTAKIIKLQTSNVKRLAAVEINPDGSLVVIGGNNGAGKSSVLDSIMYALCGKSTIPSQPIRQGEKRAKTVVKLSNGLTVTRTYDASGSQLTATGPDGEKLKSPQTILDRLVGDLSFDPLEFSRRKPKEQAELLRRLSGVDTTKLDADRARAFETRTDKGRDLKREKAQLDAAPEHPDAPAEEVSIAALTDELAAMQRQASENAKKRSDARLAGERAERGRRDCEAEVHRIDNRIVELRSQLEQVERDRATNVESLTKAQQIADEQRAALRALDSLTDPDDAPVRERIKSAEAINGKVRANRARVELAGRVDALSAEVEKLSSDIDRIDLEKREMLAAAKLPIAWLGFDEDGVTLAGLPLEQASQAERLRVSVAMGMALNPELRLLLVRDGALLDLASLRMMAEMAELEDFQILLERVGDGPECSVIIEDGHVRAASAEDAAQ